MLKADELQNDTREINGKWVIARPIKQNLKRRFKDAIKILKGEAEAVIFYKQ